jgi:hypothetical protein
MKFAKNRVLVYAATVAALALMVVSAPANVQAQSVALSVTIPFQFNVGNTALPAGTYVVTPSGGAIIVSDQNGHTANVITHAVWNRSAGRTSQLMFNRYGDAYFLSEVRWSGYPTARGLMKSKAETRIASGASPELLATAANKP